MSVNSQIEALLFVSGNEGLTLTELSLVLNVSTATAYDAVMALKDQYETSEISALTILEVGDRFLLSTKKRVCFVIKRVCTISN